MTTKEYINRGFNLLAISIVGLSAFAFLPEVIFENDIPDKIDDAVLFVLGLFGIWWYNRASNKFTRSLLPVVLVTLALLTKIGAIVVEFDDAASVGDDFGALVLFVLSLGLVLYQFKKVKTLGDSVQ